MATRRRRTRQTAPQPPALQELAASTAAAVVLVLGGGGVALALPEGMVVTGGQLELSRPDANQAVLNQGSQRAAADFQSFDIGAGQRVQIVQPNAASALLGRVVGGNLTQIHGQLDANGRVLLVNPAGVLVGPTGVINTAAFTATTLNVDPAKFMEGGRLELKAVPGADPNAAVINQGTISVADGGFAALIAPHVVNNGLITARLGQVQLASGTSATLDISGDGLLGVVLDPAVAGSITNAGTVKASMVRLGGGEAQALVAAAVNLGGVIEARSGADLLTGISIESAGQVTISGRLDASSTTSRGGSITIQGAHISVASSARLDATGETGGGQVLIGGSWQNENPAIRQAITTSIEAGAVVDASATGNGSGGTIVAWSDITNPGSGTTVAGTLLAKGGSQGGDGGRIETSGYDLKVDGIRISTEAPLGITGEWLLDPYNITISNGTQAGVDSSYNATANSAVINASALVSALGSSNVTVFTGNSGGQAGDITVDAPIASSSSHKLTLQAARNIVLNQNLTRDGSGGLALVAGGGSVSGTGDLILGGGTTLSLSPGLNVSNNIQLVGNATIELKLVLDYLIVGGGGGGATVSSGTGGGGGGGGQVLQGQVNAGSTSYSITVGARGAGGTYQNGYDGTAGGSSSALLITASGGSGGKILNSDSSGGQSGAGFAGGSGVNSKNNITTGAGGGGGGAGGAGTAGTAGTLTTSPKTPSKGGNGGIGVASTIEGSAVSYGGGGGGGPRTDSSEAIGIAGTGTDGGANAGNNADANTGGGGGGGASISGVGAQNGGAGGSGLVILRYAGPNVGTTGGIASTSNGYIFHKFTNVGTTTFTVPELTATLSGVISNTIAGNLTFNAPSATVNLTGKNTYTGNTTISAGTMKLAGDGAIGWDAASSTANYAANIANSGTLVFSSTLDQQIVSGNISGAGTLTVNTSATTASSNQIFGGGSGSFVPTSSPTVIASNTTVQEALSLINGARLAGSGMGSSTVGSVHFRTYDSSANPNTATFQIQAVDGSTSKGVLVELQQSGTDVTARVVQAGSTTSSAFGRDIANWSSQSVATDSSTGQIGIDQLFTADRVVLTGNNTYTGPTNVTSGVLEVAGSGSLGYVAAPATPSHSGSIAFGSRGALVFSSSQNQILSGAFSGSGEILKFGATDLTLTGGTSTYTGKLAATGGSLIVDGAGVLSTGTHSGGVALSGDATFRYSSTTNQTMSGDIIGRGRVIKEENSNLTLSGYKRWASDTSNSGDTDVRAGTLTLSGSSAISGITDSLGGYGSSTTAGGGSLIEIGSGATLAIAGSTLEFNGATVRFGSSGGGTVTSSSSTFLNRNTTYRTSGGAQNQISQSSGSFTLEAGTVLFDVASGTNTNTQDLLVSAVMGGSAAVHKSGAGLLSFSGNNTYTGGTTISNGTLQLGTGSTGSTTGTAGSGDIVNDAALIVNRSNAINLPKVISGSGTLTKKAAGALTLSGANTYSGITTLDAGSLLITHATGLGSTSAGTTVAAGAVLDIRGVAVGTEALTLNGGTLLTSTGTASLDGDVALGSSSTVDVGSGAQLSLSGVVSGATSALTKTGAGTLVLSGANSYGATTISAGTLQIGGNGTTGTLGSGAVTNNAALVFHRSDALTVASAISGSGSLTKLGAGTLTLTGANSYGATTISAGTLQIGNDDTTGTLGSGSVTNNSALVFRRSNAITVANAIGGSGSLQQAGAGALTLTSNGTYTGATTIDSGSSLILQNNAPTSASSSFGGPGVLAIEPSGSSFSSTFSTNGWSLASTLGGLRLGKAGNTAGITLANANPISIAGGLSLYGGTATVSQAFSSSGAGSLLFEIDSLSFSGSGSLASVGGQLQIHPRVSTNTIGLGGASGSFALASSVFSNALQDGFAGITIGRASHSGKITVGSIAPADNLTLHNSSGGIEITGLLNAGANTLVLDSTGSITDTGSGALTAAALAINNASSAVLDAAANSVGTVAASGAGALTLVNSGTLTVGTVNPTGISATGTVRLVASGDLLVNENITTTNTSASAVVLIAGSAQPAGTATGGDVQIASGRQISFGAGGTGKLYSGSVAGSTGVTDAVGSGSGNFRYNSTESTTNFAKAIGAGLHAIYREAPSVSVTIPDQSVDYGDQQTPSITGSATGLQNGDLAAYAIVSPLYTNSGYLKVGTYALQTTVGSQLGYVVSATTGNLTVNQRTLSLAGLAANNKIYDGNASATLSNFGTLTGIVSTDAVSLAGAYTAAFADRHVGDGKTVTVSNLTLSGADAANYVMAPATTTANISRLATVSWIGGGATNSWFDPANWAGGAVPDRSNVASVDIPAGAVVDFSSVGAVSPADPTQPVYLESLGSSGSLNQADGTLNIGAGGLALASYAQTGGSLITSGNLSLSDGFSQGSSGSIQVGGNANIADASGGLVLGNITVTGTTTINSTDGAITQAAGTSLIATGASSFTASQLVGGTTAAADITLSNAGNDFVGVVSSNGRNIALVDGNGGITLGATTATGTLSVTSSGGALTQQLPYTAGNAISVTGAANFVARNGATRYAITLENPDNNFGARVSLDGAAVSIRDADALSLGTVTTSGDLTVRSSGALDLGLSNTVGQNLIASSGNGPISQSGALSVSESANLDAGSGDIALSNAGNDFVGVVSSNGGSIVLVDGNGGINLGATTATGTLSVTSSGGALTQQLPYTAGNAISVTGAANFVARNGATRYAITLENPDNNFGARVSLDGAAVSIRDTDALNLGTVTTSGDLTVRSSGALDLGLSNTVGQNLIASSGNGPISQSGALSVSGSANLDAGNGDVTLNDASNDFVGVVSLIAAGVTIADSNALSFAAVTTSGDFTVSSSGALNLGTSTVVNNLMISSGNGPISQSGALNVSGSASLDAGSGDIALSNASNDFVGLVSLSGAGITIADANALSFAAVTTSGDFTVSSRRALNLGTSTVGNNLMASSGNGSISQSGALRVSGQSDLNAGTGDIRIDNAFNDLVGLVSLSGRSIAISDATSMGLGRVNASQNLVIRTGGSLDLGPTIVNGSLDVVAGSDITQYASIFVSDKASFDAGPARVLLLNVDNKFLDGVALEGSARRAVGFGVQYESIVEIATAYGDQDFTRTATVVEAGLQQVRNGALPADGFTGSSSVSSSTTVSGAASAGATTAPQGRSSPVASEAGGRSESVAVREGPLNPNFRVEEQVPERYSMGRGSIQVAPGTEVCLNAAGCGGAVNADQFSSLEIERSAAPLLSWLGRSR